MMNISWEYLFLRWNEINQIRRAISLGVTLTLALYFFSSKLMVWVVRKLVKSISLRLMSCGQSPGPPKHLLPLLTELPRLTADPRTTSPLWVFFFSCFTFQLLFTVWVLSAVLSIFWLSTLYLLMLWVWLVLPIFGRFVISNIINYKFKYLQSL